MKTELQYGTTAKLFHWLIVALLIAQYSIGWFMPDIHGHMKPGAPMIWHISIGTTILALVLLQLAWRLAHPVAPESSLPAYQRIISQAVHWLLYALVLLTTFSGWLFASARGWQIAWFFALPFPMLTGGANPALLKTIDGLHQVFEWTLLVVIGVHLAGAFVHLFYYHDGVMRRILPRRSAVPVAKGRQVLD
jgi:cytochrome b561